VDPRPENTVDYVLGRFTPQEWKVLFPVLERGVDAIDAFRTCDINTVMTSFNRR
jgi:peptidyl-tRNA hydrolase